MQKERIIPAPKLYMRIFQGDRVSLHEIAQFEPEVIPAIEAFMNDGRLQADPNPDDPKDLIIWCPAAIEAIKKGQIKKIKD